MDQSSDFVTLVENAQVSKNSLVCVGLDPDLSKFPSHLKEKFSSPRDLVVAFNRGIIDATAPYTSCFKPQSAFYEGLGYEGYSALADTIDYIKTTYPDIPVILDAKRGDIGSTNAGYVTAAFDVLQADAVTINPYLGKEAMQPFLTRHDKTTIVLVRTSNPGSGEIQDLPIHIDSLPAVYKTQFGDLSALSSILGRENVYVYEVIAYLVSHVWNEHNNVGVVVGATYPEELTTIRKIIGDQMLILIPGIGAQGGEAKDIIGGLNAQKRGGIVSSSRSILYASANEDFAEAAGKAAEKLRDEINQYR